MSIGDGTNAAGSAGKPTGRPSKWTPPAIAENLAAMVVEWVDGGIKAGTDWRPGLAAVIAKRLRRFADDNDPPAKPIDWTQLGFDTNVAINQAFEDAARCGVGFVMVTPEKSECLEPDRIFMVNDIDPRGTLSWVVSEIRRIIGDNEGRIMLADLPEAVRAKIAGGERVIAGARKLLADRPVAPHPVDVARRMDAFMSERDWPKVLGVGRDAGNDRVLLVSFETRPDDDDLREFHDAIANRKNAP